MLYLSFIVKLSDTFNFQQSDSLMEACVLLQYILPVTVGGEKGGGSSKI